MSLSAQVADGKTCGRAIGCRNCVVISVGVLRVFGISMRMVTHVADKGPTSNGRQAKVQDRDVDEGKL